MHAQPFALWAAMAALSAFALAMLLPPLLGRPRSRRAVSHARSNAAIHRVTLEELDRALAEGSLSGAEHRAEVDQLMRRVLEEDIIEAKARGSTSRGGALAVLLALPALAVAVYVHVGNPAAALAASHEGPASLAALERHLERSPADARAWVMLARSQFEHDRFNEAAASYRRALDASPKVARDAEIWCELADALAMAQGAVLAGSPRAMIERALALDAGHPRALEMAGSAAVESLDYPAALVYWENLATRLAPGSDERAQLERAIVRVRSLERERSLRRPAAPVAPGA